MQSDDDGRGSPATRDAFLIQASYVNFEFDDNHWNVYDTNHLARLVENAEGNIYSINRTMPVNVDVDALKLKW